MISYVVLVFILRILVVDSGRLVKTRLLDDKLCNNGDTWAANVHFRPSKCFNSHYTKETPCDPRSIPYANCNLLEANVDSLSVGLINEIAKAVDSDESIRRISIVAFNKATSLTPINNLVDSFLLPRPAWSVVQEPYSLGNPYHFTFERYNQRWDPYLTLLAENQFPSQTDCLNSHMMVQHEEGVHPGYSDVRRHYFAALRNFTHILGIYVPAQDPKTNLTGFISPTDCPVSVLNRWQCAFLLPTNCSLPSDVYLHRTREPHVYDRADSTGKLKPSSWVNTLDQYLEAYYKKNHSEDRQWRIHKAVKALRIPPLVYLAPYNHTSNEEAAKLAITHSPSHEVEDSFADQFIFMNFLFRKTAFYRRRVFETLQDFRVKYKLGDTIRTEARRFVAAHIRRGDRMLHGVNMVEWCHNATKPRVNNQPNMCQNEKHVLVPCPTDAVAVNAHVYGCDVDGDVPVGAVTLAAIIRQAELLVGPSIKNLIVFSDDVMWLQAEIRSMKVAKPQWNVFTLDAPALRTVDKNQKSASSFDIRRDGTAAGVLFQATIELAQQCDALIGHFSSGVPLTLMGAMCHHHAELEGVCPPVYDMKQGL